MVVLTLIQQVSLSIQGRSTKTESYVLHGRTTKNPTDRHQKALHDISPSWPKRFNFVMEVKEQYFSILREIKAGFPA